VPRNSARLLFFTVPAPRTGPSTGALRGYAVYAVGTNLSYLDFVDVMEAA
jgi:hypothetical protein